jgi:hypothetical protein
MTVMNHADGLTMPGKCQSCGAKGPRFRFRNDFAQPVIRMDLCLPCMRTALRCMGIFMRTQAGRQALAAKQEAARQ